MVAERVCIHSRFKEQLKLHYYIIMKNSGRSKGTRQRNLTRTATFTKQYPRVCWVNISFSRMSQLKNGEFYYFECTPGDLEVTWKVESQELRYFVHHCGTIENSTPRYSFYINPRTGTLHTSANEEGNSLKLILCD